MILSVTLVSLVVKKSKTSNKTLVNLSAYLSVLSGKHNSLLNNLVPLVVKKSTK
jgi:hypothetical protein